MKVRESDRADMISLLKALRGVSFDEAKEIATEAGLSTQRARALVKRYGGRRWRCLGGRHIGWIDSYRTSHRRDAPGITNHAAGTSGYSPAEIFTFRKR